jgi:eukaryotic-like serine/threonine-protein kinase
MGVVYGAYDPELDRRVALKLIRARRTADPGETSRDRLLREAQAMARVSHPNVVHVYDVGIYRERVFVAMELVEGETLSRWMKSHSGDWRQTLAVFVGAGRGLAAAHAAGLVHRDFKPDNVLIGKDGRARVTDFGLARPPNATVPRSELPLSPNRLEQRITETGALVGTPAYMAPEQMTGEPADARADVFSFCVALYEALYGTRPFVADSLAALAGRIATQRVTPPPPSSPVPARLRATLLRGLRADPDERFATMEALLAELDLEPAARRRARMMAAVGLLAALVILGGFVLRRVDANACSDGSAELAGVWDGATRRGVEAAFVATGLPYARDSFAGAARNLDSFVAAWKSLRLSTCEATRVRGEQSAELFDLKMECLENERRALAATTRLFSHADAKIVEKAIAAATELPAIDGCADSAALRGPLRPALKPDGRKRLSELSGELAEARAQLRVGHVDDATARAHAIAAEAHQLADRPLEAEALLVAAEGERMRGHGPAQQTIADAILAAEAGRADETLAHAWITRVDIEQDRGGVEELKSARESARHARAYASRMSSPRLRYELALTLKQLANADGDWNEERRQAEDAVQAARTFGEDSVEYANALTIASASTNAPIEHIDKARRALALTEKLYGPEHPQTADATLALATALVSPTGSPLNDEAIVQFRRAIAIYEKTIGRDAPTTAFALSRLSDVLSDHGKPGDFAESVALQQRAVAIYRAQNPNGGEVGSALALLAGIYVLNDRWAEALPRLDEAERAMVGGGKASPYVGWLIYRQRGKCLRGLGRYDEAVRSFDAALATHLLPDAEAETEVELIEALGRRHRDGDIARALVLARKARPILVARGIDQTLVARIDRFVAQHGER